MHQRDIDNTLSIEIRLCSVRLGGSSLHHLLSTYSNCPSAKANKAETSGPAVAQTPSGVLINNAADEGCDDKDDDSTTIASMSTYWSRSTCCDGYNSAGEPRING
jgi:hypothetical protein